MTLPGLWIFLILLQALVIDRRDLGDYLGPDELQVLFSSNKICITVCEWRLEKINNISSLDIGLMIVATQNCHCFPKRKCFSRKDNIS